MTNLKFLCFSVGYIWGDKAIHFHPLVVGHVSNLPPSSGLRTLLRPAQRPVSALPKRHHLHGQNLRPSLLNIRWVQHVKTSSLCDFLAILGTTISLCIALCNISVICELRLIGRTQRGLIRRSSRKSMGDKCYTAEELSFAKLMAAICIIFVICWMPQMVLIFYYLYYPSWTLDSPRR